MSLSKTQEVSEENIHHQMVINGWNLSILSRNIHRFSISSHIFGVISDISPPSGPRVPRFLVVWIPPLPKARSGQSRAPRASGIQCLGCRSGACGSRFADGVNGYTRIPKASTLTMGRNPHLDSVDSLR